MSEIAAERASSMAASPLHPEVNGLVPSQSDGSDVRIRLVGMWSARAIVVFELVYIAVFVAGFASLGNTRVLPQVGDFLVNETFGEAELGAAGLNHGVRSGAALPCGSSSSLAAIVVVVVRDSGRPGNTRSSRTRTTTTDRK